MTKSPSFMTKSPSFQVLFTLCLPISISSVFVICISVLAIFLIGVVDGHGGGAERGAERGGTVSVLYEARLTFVCHWRPFYVCDLAFLTVLFADSLASQVATSQTVLTSQYMNVRHIWPLLCHTNKTVYSETSLYAARRDFYRLGKVAGARS
jgi:hypothetical protein